MKLHEDRRSAQVGASGNPPLPARCSFPLEAGRAAGGVAGPHPTAKSLEQESSAWMSPNLIDHLSYMSVVLLCPRRLRKDDVFGRINACEPRCRLASATPPTRRPIEPSSKLPHAGAGRYSQIG